MQRAASASGGVPARRTDALPATEGRVVRFFDFDERRWGNREELPMFWVKRTGPGLPHYVGGRIVQGVGRSSNFSFRFDLNGGSVVYAFDPMHAARGGGLPADLPGPISVQHGATYRVEVFVKTTPLEHARARLTAFLVDRDGRTLQRSVRHSALYRGQGPTDDWHPLTVDVHVDDRAAAYLVVELGLLQPSLYAPQTLGPRTLFNQDVNGSAWFTDLSISQVPDLSLSVASTGSVVPRGRTAALVLRVADRDLSDLFLRLELHDAEGRLVHQRSGELGTSAAERDGDHRQLIELPELAPGWYRASVTLSARGQTVASGSRSLIQLPDEGGVVSPDPRFGIIADDIGPPLWHALPSILTTLSAGRVKLAVWAEGWDVQAEHQSDFDLLLDRLQDLKIMPSAVIAALPPAVAEVAGSPDLNRLATLEPSVWKPRLMYLVSRHAQRMDRWQFGRDEAVLLENVPRFRRGFEVTRSAMAELIAPPLLAMPWPATRDLEGSDAPAALALRLPPEIPPDQLTAWVAGAGEPAGTVSEGRRVTTLTLVPHTATGGPRVEERAAFRRLVLRDSFQRLVLAAASDARRIDWPLPYHESDPDELLLVVRTAFQALSNTTYRGPLRLHEGVDVHLFQQGNRGVLAMWRRDATAGDPVNVQLDLGGRPVRVDLWGNRTPLRPVARGEEASPAGSTLPASPTAPPASPSAVAVTLDDLPVFVDAIDPLIALFRMSVKLDSNRLQSQFQPQTRKLRLTNPFQDFLSGTVRLRGPAGWTLTPSSFNFNLNPGETLEREVQFEVPLNALATVHPLVATFELVGTTPPTVVVPLELHLGLDEVTLRTQAVREGGDVVVQLVVSNTGDKPISFTAFALLPGMQRQERLISGLAPGAKVIRRFRFAGVPAPAADGGGSRSIRVGLRELDGQRLLNDEVTIP